MKYFILFFLITLLLNYSYHQSIIEENTKIKISAESYVKNYCQYRTTMIYINNSFMPKWNFTTLNETNQ